MKKNIFTIIVLVIVIALLGYLGFGYVRALTTKVQNPIVTMEIEGYGTIEMELYPDQAPNTVKNFINLIQKGYYNGKVFSGVDNNCVYAGKTDKDEIENAKMSMVNSSIEAGSTEDKDYSIAGEFIANGYEGNTIKHEKGVLSMCRIDYTQYSSSLVKQSFNSANAQFCVLINDERGLNGMYAAFGRVTKGMDIIEIISKLDTKKDESAESTTTEDSEYGELKSFDKMPVIKSATVDTFGVDYGMPEVSEAFDYYTYMYNYYSQQSNK